MIFASGREGVFSREDWRGVIDMVTNAKQVVASVQDVARKLAEYAKFRGETKYPGMFSHLFYSSFSNKITLEHSNLESFTNEHTFSFGNFFDASIF